MLLVVSLQNMPPEGSKHVFSATWCGFLMLVPQDSVPDEEFAELTATETASLPKVGAMFAAVPCLMRTRLLGSRRNPAGSLGKQRAAE